MTKTEVKTTEILYHNPKADEPKKDFTMDVIELDPFRSLGEYYVDKKEYYKHRQNSKPQPSGE